MAIKSFIKQGWSLLELLVAVAIAALLITLAFPTYSFIRAQLDSAACVGNMKALHAGLSSYMQDHNMMWPQPPGSGEGSMSMEDDSDENWVWWYETLKPYEVTRKTWICPADRDGQEMNELSPETLVASYSPTNFDDMPNSAYRWKIPWIIERGQNHGHSKGPHQIFADGQIGTGVGVLNEPP